LRLVWRKTSVAKYKRFGRLAFEESQVGRRMCKEFDAIVVGIGGHGSGGKNQIHCMKIEE
jgi:hypothetical protein